MIEFIAFVLFIFVFILLLVNNLKLRIERLGLLSKNLQLLTDSAEIAKILEKSLALNKKESPEDKDGFIQFLSQSREWAFLYIENVQLLIDKFIKDIEPEISYFDEYGTVGSAYPHYSSMKKISEAYKNLKEVLPEDYDKIEQ